jgi:hypothetical protein
VYEGRLKPDRLLSNPPDEASWDFYLDVNECLVSDNGTYYLCYESDGNIHIYKGTEKTGVFKINSRDSYQAGQFGLDYDGTLYANNGTIDDEDTVSYWYLYDKNTTADTGTAPFEAALANNGTFMILDANNRALFAIYRDGSASDGECLIVTSSAY